MIQGIVRGQNLGISQPLIVASTNDYIEARFIFLTSDWESLSKWAHFTLDDTSYTIELNDEDMIDSDAHLNLSEGTWKVSLHGTATTGTTRITTEEVEVIVQSSGAYSGEPLSIPLSVGEQILQIANEALDTANEALEAASNGSGGTGTGTKGEKGDKGDKGDDGASAYEIAVENGFEGTETEWLESLKGEKGDKGDTGATGATGADGKDGEDGADGATPSITATATVDETTGTPTVSVTKSGTDAAPTFAFAFTGIKGEQGEKGDTGATGAQGEKGDTGDSGVMSKVTSTETTVTEEIQPNCYYSYGEVTSLTLTLATPTDDSIANEYAFSFDSGDTATTITLPDTVVWASEPSIETSKHYEVSILDNYGIVLGF